MKVPDTSNSWVDGSLTLEQCRAKCFENCSCSAYANLDIKGGGSGCVIWFGDLLDLREVSGAWQDLCIRLDPSEKDKDDKDETEGLELPLFDLDTIAHATSDFSSDKKLGEGGFGPVYKAWRLWKEGDPLEFLDPCLRDSCIEPEVLSCIHIGLLCVQRHPHDRPNMASVVVMLNNESVFPHPEEPGFFMDQLSSGKQTPSSINEITATQLEPR